MADEDASERTEAASAQRLVRARAQGNLPLSRDLASVVTLAAGTGILMLLGAGDGARHRASAARLLGKFGGLGCHWTAALAQCRAGAAVRRRADRAGGAALRLRHRTGANRFRAAAVRPGSVADQSAGRHQTAVQPRSPDGQRQGGGEADRPRPRAASADGRTRRYPPRRRWTGRRRRCSRRSGTTSSSC